MDELHGVVVHPLVLADAEHGHDIGVMQVGRHLGFAGEAVLVLRVEQHLLGQHLERHPAPQRLLLGLVDDAHAAAADFADDVVVAEFCRCVFKLAVVLR